MLHDNRAELKQFLDISQQMLAFAEVSDWEKLPELENHRTRIMQSFFETQTAISNSTISSIEIEQTIKTVLSINEKIEELAKQQKVIVHEQLHSLKKKQNVHSAYLQNK